MQTGDLDSAGSNTVQAAAHVDVNSYSNETVNDELRLQDTNAQLNFCLERTRKSAGRLTGQIHQLRGVKNLEKDKCNDTFS